MRCDDKTEVLRIFAAQLEETPKANFVCFRSGDRKAGTNHISVTGKVWRIDETAGQIILLSGEKIPIHSICDMQSEWVSQV